MEKQIREIMESSGEEIHIFRLLDQTEIRRIAEIFKLVRIPANTVYLREGDSIGSLGIIASGKLQFERHSRITGKPILLAILEKGAHIGNFSILTEREALGQLRAVEDTELIVCSHADLDTFMQEHPHTGIKIMKGISTILLLRLKKAIDKIVWLS